MEKIKIYNLIFQKFEKFKNKISYHALENMNVDENIKLKKNWSKFHLVINLLEILSLILYLLHQKMIGLLFQT